MDMQEAARQSVYLLFAARAGRATKQQWQRWADRLIEQDMVNDWIIAISLARDVEQFTRVRPLPATRNRSSDAVLGHLWARYRSRELSLAEFLNRAAEEADGPYQTSIDCAYFYEQLEAISAGTPESVIVQELELNVGPMRIEADLQLSELFPES